MRYCAFLRAINVGGRNVKMADLKKIFESAGFKDVETYIASGNVVFGPGAKGYGPEECERMLSARLLAKLKYDHTPFVRTLEAVTAIAAYTPFPEAAIASARSNQIGFVSGKITLAAKKRIEALGSGVDTFRVRGSEIFWLSSIGAGESKITKAMFEKAVGGPVTWRNVNTVRAMAAKYAK